MSAVLAFRVLGVAIPFVRVKPGKSGGAYEPATYKHWKSQIADAARDEMERVGWTKCLTAVRVGVEIVLVKRNRKSSEPWPISGKGVGDIENYIKPVLDGMTVAGVYRDDMQVCRLHPAPEKRWQREDEEFAGVNVRVEAL